MGSARLKFSGWGREDETLPPEELAAVESVWARYLDVSGFDATPMPTAEDISLRAPRVTIPGSLAEFCTTDTYERLLHSYGKSAHDLSRIILRRDFSNPPDAVALPRSDAEIAAVLDWCGSNGHMVIPFGGGSSVVGGVTPPRQSERAIVTLDLRHLNRVLEVDDVSEAARIQAGIFGPDLERQLRPTGLTMRFFPQSFEFSTLGGWIATRAAGHFATGMTQIDDHVESLRVHTPAGTVETRRLPASGAGPGPDRMFLGSEGALGVVSEAWIKLRKRPVHRNTAVVRFADFHRGADAVRALSQSGLNPANCRLVDAEEAAFTGAGNGRDAILILAFESAIQPVDWWMKQGLEICADLGGRHEPEAGRKSETHKSGAAGQWRDTFFRAPYYREHAIARGVMRETFESAVAWSAFPSFHQNVTEALRRAVEKATGRPGLVTCRLTHVYPDGPAPYFTYYGFGDKAKLVEQFWEIKAAGSSALVDNGGTITHHHAVGRDHRAWYDQERPGLFAEALKAAKRALDPQGILNPGVLVDVGPAAPRNADGRKPVAAEIAR